MDRSSRAVLAAVAIIAVSACSVAGPPGAGTPAGGGEATAAGQTPGSDQASDAGSATKPDPCSLLTPDELKTQLDVDFQPGLLVGTPSAPHVECQWAEQGKFVASLTLAMDDIGSAGWGCLGNAEPVPGVGDEACFGDVGLHVKRGSWDLVFSGCEQCFTNDQLIDVAKVAVSRL
jgi:hypothetical protein